MIIYPKPANECKKVELAPLTAWHPNLFHNSSVKLRENDTVPELAEPYFYYGQALLYLGLGEQQVFGSDIVKGELWFASSVDGL